MKKVLTADEMRRAEQALFDTGVSSLSLMERAAAALAQTILKSLNGKGKTCVFACGSGGNGGDGYAAARLFAEAGGRAILLPVLEPKTPDAKTNFERAKSVVFAVASLDELDRLPVPDAWADCIFGIGANRAAEGNVLSVIERINADHEKGALVVSADIPSGLSADTGLSVGTCVQADETVTFQALKRGHLAAEGRAYCGNTAIAPIGIPETTLPGETALLVETSDALAALPKRGITAHKNDFGHLLIVAGSRGMAGAAAICARAAMRSGAGLTTVACPESIMPILQTLAPCAMCVPLPEKDGAIAPEAGKAFTQALAGKTAVAVGCGLSRRASKKVLEAILKSGLPAVFDADALNLIAEDDDLKALLSPIHALTPHPGEAARLLGEKIPDPFRAAKRLRELGANVLLKGAVSLIQGDKTYLSASGCPGMAKGGSGDALTGIVGALLAQGLDPEMALWAGSEIHGRAGELASKRYGTRAMLPTDLVECLGAAMDGKEE